MKIFYEYLNLSDFNLIFISRKKIMGQNQNYRTSRTKAEKKRYILQTSIIYVQLYIIGLYYGLN